MPVSNQEVRPFEAGETDNRWSPETEADRANVREQLGRILASDLFANSKRYPSLLRYIVEETLACRAPNLKERTLGVEVFGRDPSYDTNADPVVRTSAAQVRHRLAQYYGSPGRETELRIDLAPGSYVPRFRPHAAEAASTAAPEPATLSAEVPVRARRRVLVRWLWLAGVPVLLLALTGFFFARRTAPDPVSAFWGPVWDKANPIVICVPGNFPTPENPAQSSGVAFPARPPGRLLTIGESLGLNSIAWPDAAVLYSVAGFMQAHGQQYWVRRERDLPFPDLRARPAVMVGGPFNNQWLKRLTSGYRFSYRREGGTNFIADSRNPRRKDWRVDLEASYSSFDIDYGIFSRVWDLTTENWLVVASGIASYGTVAAGEFLTNPRHLAMLARQAPNGWERKNIQVVFATKVLNGNAGPPQILAVHVW